MAAEAGGTVDPLARDPRGDASRAALSAAASVVVGPASSGSACSLLGRVRGRSRLPERTPGTASSVGASAMLSWRFAPVTVRASGVPRASVTAWRLVPGLPRPVGLGPVAAPPFWRQWTGCRATPGPNPTRLPGAGVRAAHGAAAPTPLTAASRVAAASRACPGLDPGSSPNSRTPRAVASPTEDQTAAQTRSPAARPGWARVADRPSASVAPRAAAAQPPSTSRRLQAHASCQANPRDADRFR